MAEKNGKRKRSDAKSAGPAAPDGGAPTADLLAALKRDPAVSRAVQQTVAHAEQLCRRNEQLRHFLNAAPGTGTNAGAGAGGPSGEQRAAAHKALQQNVALVGRLYAHLGAGGSE